MKDLYIIHGWTYDATKWDDTLKFLNKRGLRVHFLNVPGLTAKSDEVWTIEKYMDWADKNIPDGSIALGHSNGGRILLNLCAKKPEKLSHLILMDSAGIYEPSTKKKIIKIIAKIGKPLKKVPLINKIFRKLTGSSDYDKAPENMKRTLENMLESDKSLDITKVTTKTSIIWGKKDTITPPRHAYKINSLLKNSTLTFYAEWPHSAYLAHSEELADAIWEIVQNA